MKNNIHILQVSLLILIIYCLAFISINYFPTAIFEDDVYFYFQIAKNILDLKQSTFDSISITNGYHPLWMIILTIIASPLKLFGFENTTFYSASFIFSGCLVWSLILLHLRSSALLLGGVLALYCGLCMETPLAALILIIIIKKVLNKQPISIYVYFLVFTRIDMLIALIPLLFIKNIKNKKNIIVAIILGIASVSLYHFLITDYPYSISSFIKSNNSIHSSIFEKFSENISSAGNIYRYSVLIIINILVIYAIYKKNIYYQKDTLIMWIMIILSSNIFVISHTFVSSVRDWYFTPSLIPILYLWSYVYIEKKLLFSNIYLKLFSKYSLNIVSLIGVILYVGYIHINLNDLKASKEFTDKLQKKELSGNLVYAYDGSAYLGWRLNGFHWIVNGDGYVNSFDYFHDVLKKNNLKKYMNSNNIKYYILNNSQKTNSPGLDYFLKESQYRLVLASRSSRPLTKFRLYEILD